jgi:hypothetical protein
VDLLGVTELYLCFWFFFFFPTFLLLQLQPNYPRSISGNLDSWSSVSLNQGLGIGAGGPQSNGNSENCKQQKFGGYGT